MTLYSTYAYARMGLTKSAAAGHDVDDEEDHEHRPHLPSDVSAITEDNLPEFREGKGDRNSPKSPLAISTGPLEPESLRTITRQTSNVPRYMSHTKSFEKSLRSPEKPSTPLQQEK
jgi:hypothetical protein